MARAVAAVVCLLAASGLPQAQTTEPADPAAPASVDPAASAGRPGPVNRLYGGMWTTHLKEPAVVLDSNWLVGASVRGYFAATYLNSFRRRAFTAGIERTVVSADGPLIGASVGYRLGVVTGYDGRFMRIARHTPVLPLAQPFVTVDVARRVGFDVSYTFVVVSLTTSYRF